MAVRGGFVVFEVCRARDRMLSARPLLARARAHHPLTSRGAPQDPVRDDQPGAAALPLGASASALNSRLQALRDVTNRKSGPQRGKGVAAAKPRTEPAACALPADPRSVPAVFEPSLTNSRAAAVAERTESAASPPPAPPEQLPLHALRSPVAGAPHPDIRSPAARWRAGAAHIHARTPTVQQLTRTARRARRISGSPVVTLSPNGRASNYRVPAQAPPTAPASHALPVEGGVEFSVRSGGEPQVPHVHACACDRLRAPTRARTGCLSRARGRHVNARRARVFPPYLTQESRRLV